MNIVISIEVIQESKKAKNAERAVRSIFKNNGCDFKFQSTALFSSLGHKVEFTTEIEADNWQETIFKTIELAQIFGGSWQICGDIHKSLCLSTSLLSYGIGVVDATVFVENCFIGSDSLN